MLRDGSCGRGVGGGRWEEGTERRKGGEGTGNNSKNKGERGERGSEAEERKEEDNDRRGGASITSTFLSPFSSVGGSNGRVGLRVARSVVEN